MNEVNKITKEELSKNKTEAEDFKMTTSIDTIVGFVIMSFCTYYYYQFINYPFFKTHETWLFFSLIAGWVLGVVIPIMFFLFSYFHAKNIKHETDKLKNNS